MATLTVGVVAVVSAVVTAPAVVGAFTAGFATAAVVSLVWQRGGDSSDEETEDTEGSTDSDHWTGEDRHIQPVN